MREKYPICSPFCARLDTGWWCWPPFSWLVCYVPCTVCTWLVGMKSKPLHSYHVDRISGAVILGTYSTKYYNNSCLAKPTALSSALVTSAAALRALLRSATQSFQDGTKKQNHSTYHVYGPIIDRVIGGRYIGSWYCSRRLQHPSTVVNTREGGEEGWWYMVSMRGAIIGWITVVLGGKILHSIKYSTQTPTRQLNMIC